MYSSFLIKRQGHTLLAKMFDYDMVAYTCLCDKICIFYSFKISLSHHEIYIYISTLNILKDIILTINLSMIVFGCDLKKIPVCHV